MFSNFAIAFFGGLVGAAFVVGFLLLTQNGPRVLRINLQRPVETHVHISRAQPVTRQQRSKVQG